MAASDALLPNPSDEAGGGGTAGEDGILAAESAGAYSAEYAELVREGGGGSFNSAASRQSVTWERTLKVLHIVVLAIAVGCFIAVIGVSIWRWWTHADFWNTGEDLVLGVAVLVTVVACFNTASQVALHMQAYCIPSHQIRIVRILLLVPVYSIASTVSVKEHHEAYKYIVLGRDIYESVVLYTFYFLVCSYIVHPEGKGHGEVESTGHERRRRVIDGLREYAEDGILSIRHPPPFCNLKPLQVTEKTLGWFEAGIMQYVLLSPCITVLSMIGTSAGFYDEEKTSDLGNSFVYLFAIKFISSSVALGCVAYMAALTFKLIPQIAPTTCPSVMSKFLAVKLIIFFIYFQQVVVMVLSPLSPLVKVCVVRGERDSECHTGAPEEDDGSGWSDSETVVGLQNWLISIEMMFLSFWHRGVFDHKPYLHIYRAKKRRQSRLSPRRQMIYRALNLAGDVHADTTACFAAHGPVGWLCRIGDVYDEQQDVAKEVAQRVSQQRSVRESRCSSSYSIQRAAAGAGGAQAPLLLAQSASRSPPADDGEAPVV